MNDKRTALYRHFAGDGTLLYVGISLNHLARLAQHRGSSDWYDDIARVEVEWHPTREAALDAEKAAIRQERPAHNVIHADFGSSHRSSPDEWALLDTPWPIPAKHALIAWDMEWLGEEYGAVAIGYQPHRCAAPDWTDQYTFTSGVAFSRWREMSAAELRNELMVQYFTLTNVYEIDPRVASQAFLNIREFRECVEAGILGPNLMGFDLPHIAKSDPRPELRYWHSVHVLPREAAGQVAA